MKINFLSKAKVRLVHFVRTNSECNAKGKQQTENIMERHISPSSASLECSPHECI